MRSFWTGRRSHGVDCGKFVVPYHWLCSVPRHGVLETSYSIKKPDEKLRASLAKTILGWGNLIDATSL